MEQETEKMPQYSNTLWRVRLFDGPRLETSAGEESRRFRSQKVGALLAYLALRLGRPCPREELYLAIWPEENETQIVANRLRVALASLRRQLEPAGVPFGTVLDVSNTGLICLRKETVWCDVAAFEKALKAGRQTEAAALLTGTLLPGYYEDWAISERQRFETLGERLAENSGPEPAPKRDSPPPFKPEIFAPDLYPLPLYLTRFFGRETEKENLQELLCHQRLVTLTGPGGMGKTRLAVETAKRISLPTVFAALAEVTEGGQIPGAILRVLGVLPSVEADLTEQLIAIFRRREPVLLLLDNAEHLIEPIAELALRLLTAVPYLSLLVTSRQSLNIAGETVLSLMPLENPSAETPAELLIEAPAVALFLDRAKKARPDFVLTPRYADAMRQICLLLEGIPLALELAAARVVMQTPAQIADSLASGLLRLQSQQHGLSARHRSLRASIQGSYDLLSPEIQRFFGGLSVFQGGWTPEAARFVTNCPETETFLEELLRRSLLVTEENEADGVMRCGFLESIRQFAAELPTEAEHESLSLRHAEYYLTLATEVSEDDIRSLKPLDAEQQNLLIALGTGRKQQAEFFPSGLIGSLYYAYIRGYNRLFLGWAEFAFEMRSRLPDIKDRVRLGIALYLIFGYVGRYELVSRIGEEMLRDADENRFPAGRVPAKLILSYAALQVEDIETIMRLSREALQETRAENEKTLRYRSLRLVAWLWAESAARTPGLTTAQSQEILRESKALAEECLAILPPHSSQMTFTRTILSQTAFALGNSAEGYAHLKAAQKIAISHGMQVMLIFCYQKECEIAIENAHFEYAALLYGAFRALREKTGYTSTEADQKQDAYLRILQRHLGEERLGALARQGEQTPSEIMAAFSLENLPVLAI